MTMEDFVASLEIYTRSINDKAMFILQKGNEPCTFKAYKKFKYTLWYIDKLRDKRFPILTTQLTSRITSPEEEEVAIRRLNLEFMTNVIKFVREEKFKLILDGSYDLDELVPDLDN